VSMWERTRQRLMGKGRCPCDDYIRKGEREKKEERRKEISHSALSIVGVRTDVKHVHHLQGVGEVVVRLSVRSVERPDGECPGIFCAVTPIDGEDDIKPLRFAFTITKAFLEDPCKRRVVRIHTTPSIRKGWVRVVGVIERGWGWRTIPVRQLTVPYN